MFRRFVFAALDHAGYLMTLALLRLYDRIAGPPPETPIALSEKTASGYAKPSPRLISATPGRDDTTMDLIS